MSKLCERPGCSESGAAVYGMVPEHLLFWIAPISGTATDDQNVLCLRHADAMSVPRGWTLDDRREEIPRLFKPRPVPREERPATRRKRAVRTDAESVDAVEPVEQLVIDGTGELPRPDVSDVLDVPEDVPSADDVDVPAEAAVTETTTVEPSAAESSAAGPDSGETPWEPSFDQNNDLDGLLEVSSPLLARAFRGTDRSRN